VSFRTVRLISALVLVLVLLLALALVRVRVLELVLVLVLVSARVPPPLRPHLLPLLFSLRLLLPPLRHLRLPPEQLLSASSLVMPVQHAARASSSFAALATVLLLAAVALTSRVAC
jgi:hypothetical protein